MEEDAYSPAEAVKKTEKKPLEYPVERIVSSCRQIIDEYSLAVLLKEPRILVFETLSRDDKEKLCAGMIKLGEVLTYCRDSSEDSVQNTGICELSINYVSVRNHFIHHHLYQEKRGEDKELTAKLRLIGPIHLLQESLVALEKCGITELSKERKERGTNKFKFEYSHFVTCLKDESLLLSKTLLDLKGVNKIPFDKKIILDNRIRNILTILMDLLDEDRKNTNSDHPNVCEQNKKTVFKLNEQFMNADEHCKDFFKSLRDNRNSICHIESGERKPYINDVEQLNFSKTLDEILNRGYLEALEKTFLMEEKKAPPVEILSEVETRKKPLAKARMPVIVVEPQRPKISALSLLAGYNTQPEQSKLLEQKPEDAEKAISEPEKKKEKKGSPPRSPKMGGRK